MGDQWQNINPYHQVLPVVTPYPTFTTSGTTNIYYGAQGAVADHVVAPQPEPGPLDWLREQVDEVRELARAA